MRITNNNNPDDEVIGEIKNTDNNDLTNPYDIAN